MIWWVLLAVALVAAVVIVTRLVTRPEKRPQRPVKPSRGPKPAPPKRSTTPAGGPQPGEIWWADVPYEDGTGHKVRPCLVLRGGARDREVLKITSQDQSDRNDHVVIPTRTWDPDADHDSWLDLTGPIRVPLGGFQDRAGTLDAKIWQKVRRLHGV
ncbi:MAG: type II toxin-antitoxin system PemK/MazF family toxin [Hamadaea sp.]|uniref:type II toxin-antitoxin system PemK/MazF family toxin n=1 Tax=Hamadaea sp. TaxID=2024425 RepID=UPI0017A5A085|nr:type II toxin-antitoxin system PemK/MazF family toxin [Hamadaea sp.]NUR69839.1 type II toxin-antitoxin system PemK/MazF family toxin [Hamadaea sp.]NUT19181.1 type II toxin-antitoxin system PemK/MazF family toxin [Hamadaea sp.]